MALESVVTYLIVIAIIASVLYGVYRTISNQRKKRARFKGRESLSLDEIYSRFFSDYGLDKADVFKHWTTVAEILSLDPGRLRPEDRLRHELGPVPGDEFDDDLDFVWYHFHFLADDASIDLNAANVQTLEDLVVLFSRKEEQD